MLWISNLAYTMKRNYKLIIFDLDGTLVDAFDAVTASLNHAFSEMNLPLIDPQIIKESVGWGETKLVKRFVEEDQVQPVLSIYRQHHRHSLKTGTKFLPGAKQVLDQLKENDYHLAIASNRPSRFTHIILKHLEIRDHFGHVLCADQVDNAKPAPDLIHTLMDRFETKPHETVYVGDMIIDVEAGKAAEVTTVGVTTGAADADDLSAGDPHHIISEITHLFNLLGLS